jgi:hypothetical protein
MFKSAVFNVGWNNFPKFQDKNVVFVYAAWLTHPTRAWAIRVRIAALARTTHFFIYQF